MLVNVVFFIFFAMLFLTLASVKEKLVNLELLNLFEHFLVAAGLTCLLVTLSFLFAPVKDDREKGSSYECGFEPFEDARTNFDVHFYIVGILFLIFDLEIAFLYPWVYSVVYLHYLFLPNFFVILFFFNSFGNWICVRMAETSVKLVTSAINFLYYY